MCIRDRVKIDSISITDDTFKANINLKLNKEFDYKMLNFSYAVYDENNNIYFIGEEKHKKRINGFEFIYLSVSYTHLAKMD